MNKNLISTIIAFFIGIGLVVAGGSLSRAQSQLQVQGFVISKYGTLLEVHDANGQRLLGKLASNGFEFSYRSTGKTISVSAVGEKITGLLPGEVKADKRSATVTATTKDRALEITTSFTLDEKIGKLITRRKIRNVSPTAVVLLTMSEYIEPALVIDSQHGGNQPLTDLLKDKLEAKFILGIDEDCWAADCPKTRPPCPLPCPMLVPSQAVMVIRSRPGNPQPKLVMLQSKEQFALESAVKATKQNNEAASEVHIALKGGPH